MVSVELVAAVALLAANAFFVATEFAITRMRPTQLDELEHEGRAGSGSVRHAVENIDAYLAACQLGITIASIGLGVVGERALHDIFDQVFGEGARLVGIALAGTAAFLVITGSHVVVGELSPKSLAIARTVRTAQLVAPPMRVFYVATKPAVDFLNALGNLLLRPFGIPPAREAGHAPHTESELRQLIRESEEKGLLEPEEREITERVFTFHERRAEEVMVPRPEVDVLTTDMDVQAAADRIVESRHTRLPLCREEGNLDEAVGLVHARDLLAALAGDGGAALEELARPLARISDHTLIDELLRDLRRRRRQMALVVNEWGTAVGVVTLEDVIEEIVGEIEDEFDAPGVEAIGREDGRAIVPGSAQIAAVAEELGLELHETRAATIGGHVVEALGRTPQEGERLDLGGAPARVTGVSGTRVTEVTFTPLSAPDPEGQQHDAAHSVDEPG